MTQATLSGASQTDIGEFDEDEAAEELLKRFLPPEDADKPSSEKKTDDKKSADPKTKADEDEEADKPASDDDEQDEGDEDEEKDEGDDDSKTEKKFADGDETYVKITVGDEEHEVPVKDLKRLFGQEASLTKKSMAVAERSKTLDAEYAKSTAATAALLEQSKKRWEPFSKIDFHLLATQVSKEDYQAIREQAQAAWEEQEFLSKHLDSFMGTIKERQANDLRERATEAIAVLSDPEKGIEGWNQKLYDDVRAFAVSQGAPAEVINEIVDPWAIKMMHAAMLYVRGRDKANVVTKKVNKTPKRITKTTESPEATRQDKRTARPAEVRKKMTTLRETGEVDDAAELMLARWKKQDSDD